MTAGCMSANRNNIAQPSPQTITTFIPGSSAYNCFELTGVSENDLSSGYLGKNIADIRRISGTVKNNCGKIMPVTISIRWFDENGKAAYYGTSFPVYRLKSGESANFQIDGYHSDVNHYGYLEETAGWTFKIGLGETVQQFG